MPITTSFSALQRAENSSIVSNAQLTGYTISRFQCSSASRKFLNLGRTGWRCSLGVSFQCSSASRKFLNLDHRRRQIRPHAVSVLFSEPKIPQSSWRSRQGCIPLCFSALQRAENSSMPVSTALRRLGVQSFSALQRAENSSIGEFPANFPLDNRRFQCSSASRKFLNGRPRATCVVPFRVSVLFSEPKIPQSQPAGTNLRTRLKFQCSSASRKFLNTSTGRVGHLTRFGFSALQRAENSSMRHLQRPSHDLHEFQCSSASRKFLNLVNVERARLRATFQCSSASRKFLNYPSRARRNGCRCVSVLFSEPKIPQSRVGRGAGAERRLFQCSSASRKFLNKSEPRGSVSTWTGFSALQRAENSSIQTAKVVAFLYF